MKKHHASESIPVEAKKVAYLRKKLLSWFETNQRIFPWREKDVTPFETLISEILLQRTKAETVAAFYPSFFEKYRSWEDIRISDSSSLEYFLKPLGLFRHRAKRLKKIADSWAKKNGVPPRSSQELKEYGLDSLYLSNAFSLFILRKKAPLLDVNMSRVLHRYFGVPYQKDVRLDKTMISLAQTVINSPHCMALNWAFLDFAALVCKARKPRCPECPTRYHCYYYQTEFRG